MKKPSEEEIVQIKKNLIAGNSKKKKSAVRKIGKFKIKTLSNDLLNCFLELKKTSRNWEIQSEMIKSLGILRVTKTLPFIEKIVAKNIEEDMITFEASKAFIRIKSKNNNDVIKNIFHLLKVGNKSVKDGAVSILSCDNIIPNKRDMLLLIKLIDNNSFDNDLDYREYLISAMANWPIEISKPYLEKYKNDSRINQAVINSSEKRKVSHLDY